jgi:transcription initiation factor TFIIIB Brf1 subunit/transcription initiation factor TFIIB
MNFEQAQLDILAWITGFVERPHPALSGWAPCPYARRARLEGKFEIRLGHIDPYTDLQHINIGELDVVALVYDPTEFEPEQFNQQITAVNQGLDSGILDLSKEYYVALTANCQKRGLSRSAVLASCVFSALKQAGQPRKPKDVADMFHIKTSDFTKAFKYVHEVLALAHQKGQLKGFSGSPSAIQSTRASHYIAHPLSKLPLKRSEFPVVLALSTAIANAAEDLSLCAEHMPPSLAAASLAEAIQLKGHTEICIDTIAGLCGVSSGTLIKCWKRLEETKEKWASMCGLVNSKGTK